MVTVRVALAILPPSQIPPSIPTMQVSMPVVTQMQALGSGTRGGQSWTHSSCSHQVSVPEVTQMQAPGSAFTVTSNIADIHYYSI